MNRCSDNLNQKTKKVMIIAEMDVCFYGDVVTENIHEHHRSGKNKPFNLAAFISTQIIDPDHI